MGNEKKTSDCEEELNDSISSSESDDSDLVEITHPDGKDSMFDNLLINYFFVNSSPMKGNLGCLG